MRSPLFRRFAALLPGRGSEHETDYETLGAPEGGLEAEYLKVLEPELRGWGVPESCATLTVQQVGLTPHGRGVFVGVIRLVAWERKPALRLLLGLPFLERRVKRTLATRWLLDVSHFAGLWLHASEKLHASGGAEELRTLLAEVADAPVGPRRGTASH